MNLFRLMLILLAGASLAACQRQDHDLAPAVDAAKDSAPEQGITLTDAERTSLGIRTVVAAAAQAPAGISGYALVLGHEAIAQAVADVRIAEAARNQSRSALARAQHLAATPGALPAEGLDAVQRQSAADEAALQLARRRLSTVVGAHPPWGQGVGATLVALAGGEQKLVRVTFPIGTLDGPLPREVRLRPLGAGGGWLTREVWEAPADAAVPGQSLFALLASAPVREGERLQATVALGPPESGVVVPASATVAHAGQYWCYVEKPAGHFTRISFDPQRPAEGGYFVTRGLSPGDAIVIEGAGLLLSRETGPAGGGTD